MLFRSTFERAGAIGANLLTHLLDHDVDELAEKIRLYRQARADHGHDPAAGQVTVMLHTFIGRDIESVRYPGVPIPSKNSEAGSGTPAADDAKDCLPE